MSETATIKVLAIVPGRGATEHYVEPGTTVAQLATQLQLPDAERLTALDGVSEPIGPNDVISDDTQVVNYIYKLAGA